MEFSARLELFGELSLRAGGVIYVVRTFLEGKKFSTKGEPDIPALFKDDQELNVKIKFF
jgi:hypothetical protein